MQSLAGIQFTMLGLLLWGNREQLADISDL